MLFRVFYLIKHTVIGQKPQILWNIKYFKLLNEYFFLQKRLHLTALFPRREPACCRVTGSHWRGCQTWRLDEKGLESFDLLQVGWVGFSLALFNYLPVWLGWTWSLQHEHCEDRKCNFGNWQHEDTGGNGPVARFQVHTGVRIILVNRMTDRISRSHPTNDWILSLIRELASQANCDTITSELRRFPYFCSDWRFPWNTFYNSVNHFLD